MTDTHKGDDAALIDEVSHALRGISADLANEKVPERLWRAVYDQAVALEAQSSPTDDASLVKGETLDALEKEARDELDAHQEWLNEHPDEPDHGVEDWVQVHPDTMLKMVAACRALAARGAGHVPDASNMIAGAGQGEAASIQNDGPHEIDTHRRWLARQLLDSMLSADEAYGIVRHHPALAPAPSQGESAPEDFVLVPREITEEMLVAAWREDLIGAGGGENDVAMGVARRMSDPDEIREARRTYRAMIAASPTGEA